MASCPLSPRRRGGRLQEVTEPKEDVMSNHEWLLRKRLSYWTQIVAMAKMIGNGRMEKRGLQELREIRQGLYEITGRK
jgi:hypothetical protein